MRKLRVLFSAEEIRGEVERLAEEIRRDYQDRNPLLIGVLKGSFVLMADLIRLLNFPLEVDFVRLSSYGAGTVTSGKVRVAGRLRASIEGRHVVVVEDIVDTGLTLKFFLNYLRRHQPASLKVCVLFDKAPRRRVPVPIDYRGFTIPDAFVVGYGLDWDEKFRYLPNLCILEEESGSERVQPPDRCR
jgi:hypoxanthine phosphoribosyltransferase